MAKNFTAKDAKSLIKQHGDWLNDLQSASKLTETLKTGIRTAADSLAEQEVEKALKSVPVEELGRRKRGLRTKALIDANFTTMADVCRASVSRLAAVRGISEDTARAIKIIADDFAKQTKKAVKVRLSADARTPEASKLVREISVCKNSAQYCRKCDYLLRTEGQTVERLMRELKPASSGLRWLFTSKANKEKAEKAYAELQAMLGGDYKREVALTLSALDTVKQTTVPAAWEDFKRDNVRFFTTLEDAAPGILGNDDKVYGLSESLAREIGEVPFLTDGLTCTLRRYQEWGVKYILHQGRVLLGDEMGLGKTVQAIATMVSLRNAGATHFAVVCPASVVTNWCREIAKHSDLRVTKVHGADRESALRSWQEYGGVAVTTYETTGHFALDDDFIFSLLIVDEAHYIKNAEAKRTVNTKELCRHAERLLFMTGTALENKVEEMIALIAMLQPEIARQVQGIAFLSSAPQFRDKIAPVYYRRKREEVLTELPELVESKEWCTMTREEERVYEDAVLGHRYADARRVSWSAESLSDSSKANRLKEIVEEAEAEDRKVIVFSFFLDTIRKITEFLGDRCLPPIYGAVSPQRRQEIIDEFDKAPAGSVLIAQIQSGGTGLNIQSASVVVICEPQFKPSIENQAISRAYRMGQARSVLVYRLLCEDTVDERITGLLEQKQTLFDAFADESVSAKNTPEIDEKSFGDIMSDELARIQSKRGTPPPSV